MRKITLDVEHLRVETFQTVPADPDGGGTVLGHQAKLPTSPLTCTCSVDTYHCICPPIAAPGGV